MLTGNTESDGLVLGGASDVLVDSEGRVDTTSLLEERADGSSGTLWCDEDDINVLWNIDLGQVLEDWGETVGEVESLSLGQLWLDVWPGLGLSSVGEEVHDDGTLGDSLINLEEVLAWDPAVGNSLLPRSTILSDTWKRRKVSDDSFMVRIEEERKNLPMMTFNPLSLRLRPWP